MGKRQYKIVFVVVVYVRNRTMQPKKCPPSMYLACRVVEKLLHTYFYSVVVMGVVQSRPPTPLFGTIKQVRFRQTYNQGLRQLFLTLSWDMCAKHATPNSVLDS